METIRLYDVTPRDGLQNEPDIVATEDKVELILNLVRAGYKDIEVTSFVRPKLDPHSWQMVLRFSNLFPRPQKEFDFGPLSPTEEALSLP